MNGVDNEATAFFVLASISDNDLELWILIEELLDPAVVAAPFSGIRPVPLVNFTIVLIARLVWSGDVVWFFARVVRRWRGDRLIIF